MSVEGRSNGFFEPYAKHGKSPLFSRRAHTSPMDVDQPGLPFECVDVGVFHG
jgi:hypothetical protein